MQKEN